MKDLKKKEKPSYPIIMHIDIDSKIYNFYQDKKINNHANTLAAYVFYYKSARKQGNIRVKIKDVFIKKGLGISTEKLRQTKKDLVEMGLIKIIRTREKNGQFSSEIYIEVSYVWKEETVNKLLYRESDETLKYKIAKKLLMDKYSDLEEIYPQNDLDFEIEVNLHGKKEVVFASYFYFEKNILKFNTELSGGECNFTLPTEKVNDILLSLANQERYTFESINRILQMKSSAQSNLNQYTENQLTALQSLGFQQQIPSR